MTVEETQEKTIELLKAKCEVLEERDRLRVDREEMLCDLIRKLLNNIEHLAKYSDALSDETKLAIAERVKSTRETIDLINPQKIQDP